jgi:putative sigma-54 modulation protein
MVLTYSAKHTEIDDEMKDYLEKKLQKVKFYFDHIINIHMILGFERGQFNSEIKVSANQDIFFATAIGHSWQESFDEVTDKVEREIKKKKDRIKNHHK